MSDTTRATQFTGFAHALLLEMLAQRQGEWIDFNSGDSSEIEEYSAIIARRAYDLVVHTIGYSAGGSYEGNYLSTGNPTGGIPDMTEFPEEE